MNNEIKEIFKRMNDLIEHQFDKEYHTECDLFKDIQMLLDYITNLQEENAYLKKHQRFHKNGVFSLEYDKESLCDMVEELQQENEKLRMRNDMLRKDIDSFIEDHKRLLKELEKIQGSNEDI